MDPKKFIAQDLTKNLSFLKDTLKDFSDADMYVRPCPGANHAAWQLGHLIGAESMFVGAADPKAAFKLPDGYGDLFKKETASIDDPKKFGDFGTKDSLIGLFEKVRGNTIAWVNSLSLADLDKPGPEKFRSWVATWADLAALQSGHVAMHVGQFQVIRRKLGKPILF